MLYSEDWTLKCEKCNTINPKHSKYCTECGAQLSETGGIPANEKAEVKSYKVLRLSNWLLSLLLFTGILMMFLKSGGQSAYVIAAILFLLVILANYAATAIVLNPRLSFVMGVPILLSVKNNSTFYPLLIGNSLFSLFGLGIIGGCVSTGQYGASISGFLYLFISVLNVRAILQKRKA
jgi:hypothetical protein